MGFTNTRTGYSVMGSRKKTWGAFTNANGEINGGTVDTGLNVLSHVSITMTSYIGSSVPKITLNSPSNGSFQISTSDAADGLWEATGV